MTPVNRETVISVEEAKEELAPQRRFRPYTDYRDSGVQWLGELPAHWETRRLKTSLCRNDGGVWGDDFDADGTIVLRSTEQTVGGDWQIDEPARRSLSTTEKAGARLGVGDLLITKSSGSELHIGKTTIVTPEVEALDCCFSNFMQRVRCKPSGHPRFVYYILNSEIGREQFVYGSNSTTGLANLNGGIIGNLRLGFPGLPEQREIAAFLDRETTRIDELIAKKQRLIELLAEKRTALISHAVTKGLNADAPMKDTGIERIGQVPRHWQVKRIKFLAQVGNGSTPSRETPEYWNGWFPWLNSSVANFTEVTEPTELVSDLALQECHLPRICPPAVLVGITGEGKTRGMATLLRIEATINQHLAFVRPTAPECSVEYVRYVLHSAYQFLRDESDGGGSTKGAITCKQLGNTAIQYPPASEQAEIAQFIDARAAKLDALTTLSRSAIDKLREYRSALISAAVTGKIDVRNEEAEC